MFGLGALHDGGHDIETDREAARNWFAQSAEHGHPIAALMFARYAARGLGGPRDMETARRWYERAVSLGVPEAAGELATFDSAPTADGGRIAKIDARFDAAAPTVMGRE